jgi:hypothetical protein
MYLARKKTPSGTIYDSLQSACARKVEFVSGRVRRWVPCGDEQKLFEESGNDGKKIGEDIAKNLENVTTD